jgi:hypothetical protein
MNTTPPFSPETRKEGGKAPRRHAFCARMVSVEILAKNTVSGAEGRRRNDKIGLRFNRVREGRDSNRGVRSICQNRNGGALKNWHMASPTPGNRMTLISPGMRHPKTTAGTRSRHEVGYLGFSFIHSQHELMRRPCGLEAQAQKLYEPCHVAART